MHYGKCARVFLASHLYFLNFQQFAYKGIVIVWAHMQINIIKIKKRQRSNATRYIADSIKVALGISNFTLEIIVWWALEKIIVLFCMPKFPMPNCQSNLELSIYTDSMKVVLVYWRVAYREFLFGGHSSRSLPWVPYAQMPNTQLPMTNSCHGNLY